MSRMHQFLGFGLIAVGFFAAWGLGCGAVHEPGDIVTSQSDDEGMTIAGVESAKFGVDHFSFTLNDSTNHMVLLGKDDAQIGTLDTSRLDGVLQVALSVKGHRWLFRESGLERSIQHNDGRAESFPVNQGVEPSADAARLLEAAQPAIQLAAAVLADAHLPAPRLYIDKTPSDDLHAQTGSCFVAKNWVASWVPDVVACWTIQSAPNTTCASRGGVQSQSQCSCDCGWFECVCTIDFCCNK